VRHTIHSIGHRLSLRPPQFESLEILERVCELLPLDKDSDPQQALEAIRTKFPWVAGFDERDFPSLCFALATGVGKTRLMGAFIAYLHLIQGVRHFFVLAPNLTIYNKLIADFTPNTPKYVFRGISDFALNAPEIITGDNYESGRGVREERRRQRTLPGVGPSGADDPIHINIFNISKINSETRGGKSPRIKRLHEYIGESYFEYLAALDDLVLLMDESHRYRASAGVRAINELKPILGLELTATPQVEKGGKTEDFKNVIYSYPLSAALRDGFVKEPAVATRENFKLANYDAQGLEDLKLQDGVRVHENTKVQLEIYARQNKVPIVKPFMLVVAQNTDHANALLQKIGSADFFHGQYKGRVITVHSNQSGEEKDETVQQLLSVEDAANSTEIVIHVNMLKEGWDVTNLYTIVPLRAANSKTLVEQSVGRGLRLPYGHRTGVVDVDRLTIVSHDRFQEIIDEAKDPRSIIKTGVVIGRDIPDEHAKVVEVQSTLVSTLTGQPSLGLAASEAPKPLFQTEAERQVAGKVLDALKSHERIHRVSDFTNPEIQKQIAEKLASETRPTQGELAGVIPPPDFAAIVAKTAAAIVELSIDIPRIVVTPSDDVTFTYLDFDLDTRNVRQQPVAHDILVQHLSTEERYRLVTGNGVVPEKRPEDYLVRGLISYDDISYDHCSKLLYKLAGQMVQHLRSYLASEEEVLNVLQYHQHSLVESIHSQMNEEEHFEEKAATYYAKALPGFRPLRPGAFSIPAYEQPRNFRANVDEKLLIRGMLFTGFKKCLYQAQRFDSDSERRFAILLEDDNDVLKWIKPAKKELEIYDKSDKAYEPDFIVETKTGKWLFEPKRASEMTDQTVLAKARAAVTWCQQATTATNDPWGYLLIPHDQITASMTFRGLAAAHRFPI
jgi:type III restriction enzyme